MGRNATALSLLSALLIWCSAARAAESDEGKRLYLTYCAACHGADGKGGGEAAVGLDESPADLTGEGFLAGKSDIELRASITGGGMMFHGTKYLPEMRVSFDDSEIFSLIEYLRSFAPIPAGDPLEGRRLFNLYCAECHGEGGHGDGSKAAYLDVKPVDLTDDAYLPTKTDADLFDSIVHGGGVHGSKFMPRWKRMFRVKEVWDLVSYVRFLHRGEQQSGNPLEGKKVFARYCTSCHGHNGKGEGPMAAVLRPSPGDLARLGREKTRMDIYFTIYGGGRASGLSESMPAWNDVLSSPQIWNLVSFIDSLRTMDELGDRAK